MENKMNAKEIYEILDQFTSNQYFYIQDQGKREALKDFAEYYARQKVLEYAQQLTMSEFIHEGHTKSVDHFFEKA